MENKSERSVIDWEVRPGGLLVQRRSSGDSSSAVNSAPSETTTSGVGPMIKIKLSYDSCYHDVTIPAQSTFGNSFPTFFYSVTRLSSTDYENLGKYNLVFVV